MDITAKQILIYADRSGREPYTEWLDTLRDGQTQARIVARVRRVYFGNLGQWRSVGEGVAELKINLGPGYRIYFGQVGATIVVLLCGGDKGSQKRDIVRAREFWKDFKERYHEEDHEKK